MKIHVGCAGWNYDDWIGSFYPDSISKTKQLRYYAKVFNFTEVNSTFYNLPKERTLSNWSKTVSENFKFSVKVWRKITHEANNAEIVSRVSVFFKRLKVLEPKIDYYLLQFPPKFTNTNVHESQLATILNNIKTNKVLVLEFRDNSWFHSKNLKNFIDGNKIILATTYMEGLEHFYQPNQAHYYIRLIGDRSLTRFNRIQKNNDNIMEEIKGKLKEIKANFKINESAVIAFNNHFSGFAPQNVNDFKKLLGLKIHPFKTQQKLTDFI